MLPLVTVRPLMCTVPSRPKSLILPARLLSDGHVPSAARCSTTDLLQEPPPPPRHGARGDEQGTGGLAFDPSRLRRKHHSLPTPLVASAANAACRSASNHRRVAPWGKG